MNTVKQVRVQLEHVSDVIKPFEEEVIKEFDMINNPFCEIQRRVIGIKNLFIEEIPVKASDDWIEYLLKDDKLVGIIICRRTEFNHAEITMITTEERKYESTITKRDDSIS